LKINGNALSPARFLVGGFAAMIIAGTVLLSLPIATKTGEFNFINALFTATSAVCVTGLVVVDTGTFYTIFGQVVIMLLILGGALGFMTSATIIFVLLGKRITLKDRLVIKEALNTYSIQGVVALIISIIKMAAFAIIAGSLLLSFRFVPQLGWSRGLFFSLFHAVSAFGNAGFDLIGEYRSLTIYTGDYLVSGTILALFLFGGLGFTVVLDLFHKKKGVHFALHTRMVLFVTVLLLVTGTSLVYLLEFNNPETMGYLGAGNKLFAAFFTAATPRTAGFNILPTDLLHPATLFLLLLLMFIGASPASTGGGIKTTTFAVLLATIKAQITGNKEIVLFEKRIPENLVIKALTIVFWALSLIFTVIFFLVIVENKAVLDITFEVFSAFGTVGLSTGITPDLTTTGKALIIITMFTGRLGPLTMLLALTRKVHPVGVRYPEEKILIG